MPVAYYLVDDNGNGFYDDNDYTDMKALDLSQKITSLYEKHLSELEDKYKKSKYKSFENALRLGKVAKKDMKIYKIIVEFWRLAFHSTLKGANNGKENSNG